MEKNGSVPSSDAKYNCAAFFPNHLNGAPLSACTARTAHDTHSAVRALDPRTTLAGAPTSSDSCPTDVFLPLVTVLDLDDALDRVTIVVVARLGPPRGRPSSSSPRGRPSSRVHLGTARRDPSISDRPIFDKG